MSRETYAVDPCPECGVDARSASRHRDSCTHKDGYLDKLKSFANGWNSAVDDHENRRFRSNRHLREQGWSETWIFGYSQGWKHAVDTYEDGRRDGEFFKF